MALFLLVLPSAVGGTKWDAVTQLIGAGVHSSTVLKNGFWVAATTEIASLKPLKILTF